MFNKVYNLMKCGTGSDENLETQVEYIIGAANMIYFNCLCQVFI